MGVLFGLVTGSSDSNNKSAATVNSHINANQSKNPL